MSTEKEPYIITKTNLMKIDIYLFTLLVYNILRKKYYNYTVEEFLYGKRPKKNG